MHAKVLQLCLTLRDPVDCRPPGSSVHGVLQARILEWIAIPFIRGSSQPRERIGLPYISCIGRRVFTTSSTWEAPPKSAIQCFSLTCRGAVHIVSLLAHAGMVPGTDPGPRPAG